MYLKVLNAQYNLAEFDLFVTEVNGKYISIVEMLIECPIEEFEEGVFKESFFINVGKSTYAFSNFGVNEFYEVDNFVKLVCVK